MDWKKLLIGFSLLLSSCESAQKVKVFTILDDKHGEGLYRKDGDKIKSHRSIDKSLGYFCISPSDMELIIAYKQACDEALDR